MPFEIPLATLGRNGPKIPRLGFGAMGLSFSISRPTNDTERLQVLDYAFAQGCTFWDSSDSYGDNEDLLGKWFKLNPDKRDKVFISSKFANIRLADGQRDVDSSPEHCKKALNKSLERMGLDYVDMYYIHRLDRKTPIEKTIQALVELKNEGKVKYFGISECSADSLRRACSVHQITAVQMEYSPFALDIEQDSTQLLKTARELGVAIVAYSPLGRGFISGNIRSRDDFDDNDIRKFVFPRFSEENFPKNLKLVEDFEMIAKEKGCTPSQLALAWLMAQGEDIFPIPGTTKTKRLDENIGSVNVQLTEEENRRIRDLCEKVEVHGSRYPLMFMQYCFADTPPLESES